MNLKSAYLSVGSVAAICAALFTFYVWLSGKFDGINHRLSSMETVAIKQAADVLIKEASLKAWGASREEMQRAIEGLQVSVADMRKDLAVLRVEIQKNNAPK